MYLGDEKVNEILKAIKVSDVIKNYIDIIPKGKDYKALCPFHNDTNPSLSISDEKGIYKCFVCGKGGNAINFVMDYLNVSFIEACKIVADLAGIKLDIKVDKQKQLRDLYYKINASAKDFYEVCLIATEEGKEAYNYLMKRGLTTETIKKFQIGLALNKNNSLVEAMKEKGFSDIDLYDLGLESKSQERVYDTFRNRIIFPLTDEKNNIVGFSGRIFHQEKLAKYLNTKETKIFKKNQLLYNYYNAKNEAIKKDSIIILEGFMDVIALDNIGVYNSIATMGTALTDYHINMLLKITKNIILLFDGDNAGIEAANKAILKIKQKANINIIVLPDGLDPDEYIKKYSKNKFLEYLDNNKLSVTDFYYLYLTKNVDKTSIDSIEKAKKKVFRLALSRNSDSVASMLLKRFAKDFLVDENAIINDYNNQNKRRVVKNNNRIKKPYINNKNSTINIKIKDKYFVSENVVVYKMLQDREFAIKIQAILGTDYIKKENYHIRNKLIAYYINNEAYDYSKFIVTLNESEKAYFDKTFLNYHLANSTQKYLDDCVYSLREYSIRQQINYFESLLNRQKVDEELQVKFSDKIINLRNDLRKLKEE